MISTNNSIGNSEYDSYGSEIHTSYNLLVCMHVLKWQLIKTGNQYFTCALRITVVNTI